jgi:hypothetical protein
MPLSLPAVHTNICPRLVPSLFLSFFHSVCLHLGYAPPIFSIHMSMVYISVLIEMALNSTYMLLMRYIYSGSLQQQTCEFLSNHCYVNHTKWKAEFMQCALHSFWSDGRIAQSVDWCVACHTTENTPYLPIFIMNMDCAARLFCM